MRLRLPILLLLVFLVTSDVGVASVMEKRKQKIWAGNNKDVQRRAQADENPWLSEEDIGKCWDEAVRIDGEREACQHDFMYLYDNYLSRPVRNRKTKVMEQQSLGAIHRLMLDFLTCHIPAGECQKNTKLWLLVDKDDNGDYPETWLYWKTLDKPPTIQTGGDCDIAKMFYAGDKIWQGVVIRLCGDGFTKCLLAPRGHLKSTIAGTYFTLWNMIRAPEERHVIRSVNSALAKDFLDAIKSAFEGNNKFIDVFGHLKPEKREAAWNTEMIQLMCANRRGVNKTVVSVGMESEQTGTHGDDYVNDDIAGESNTLTAQLRAKARGVIEKQQAQCDPGANLTDIGTRWEEDDPHVMFVGRPGDSMHSGALADYSSFFVCTVLDGDESVKVSHNLSPLGYGKPIWPEQWTINTVKRKRAGHPDDRFWCGQYFNQFAGTTNRVFQKSWIKRYELGVGESTLDFARRMNLNIYIGADTASGLPNPGEKAKRDDTGIFVMGQSQDRTKCYFLDGLREKLTVDIVAKGLVALATKWHRNVKRMNEERRGSLGNFRVAFEKTKWASLLQPLVTEEQRRLGVETTFPVEIVTSANKAKCERIRVMAPAYRDGRVLWPMEYDEKTQTGGLWVESLRGGENYDLSQLLEAEYTNYNPYATEDNLIDAHAYAWKIAPPMEWKEPGKIKPPSKQVGEYRRDDQLKKQAYDYYGEPSGGGMGL